MLHGGTCFALWKARRSTAGAEAITGKSARSGGAQMARKTSRRRKYSKSASKDVKSAMHRRKRGTLKSGEGGKGGTVKSRKQAIAIGLSEARKKGKKVPRKRSSR